MASGWPPLVAWWRQFTHFSVANRHLGRFFFHQGWLVECQHTCVWCVFNRTGTLFINFQWQTQTGNPSGKPTNRRHQRRHATVSVADAFARQKTATALHSEIVWKKKTSGIVFKLEEIHFSTISEENILFFFKNNKISSAPHASWAARPTVGGRLRGIEVGPGQPLEALFRCLHFTHLYSFFLFSFLCSVSVVIFQQEPRDEEARPSDAGRNCWGLFQRPRVVKNRTKFFVGLPNSVVCWLVVSGLTEYYCLSDNHFLFGFSPGRRLFVQRARHAAWQADAFVRQMALFVRRPDIFHSEITRPKINSIRIFVASPLQFWSAGWNEIVNYSTAVVKKRRERERQFYQK